MKKVGFFQSIRLKFIIIITLLLLFPIQVIGAYFSQQLEEKLKQNFEESITNNVDILNIQLEDAFSKERKEEAPSLEEDVQDILQGFDAENISELLVVNNKSRVIAATEDSDKSKVGKRLPLTEIQRTLMLGTVDADTKVNQKGERVLVRTFPIYQEKEKDNQNGDQKVVVGAIYLKASIEKVYGQLQDINRIFANGTFLGVSISVLLGIVIARTITKPITEMRKHAKIMGAGDFSQKVNVYGQDEIGQLAVSFNELNDKLKISQATTEGERRKLSSVLSNMTEGVIATDHTGAIILMNEPASRLLGQEIEDVQGQPLLNVLNIHKRLNSITDLKDQESIIIDFSEDEQQLLLKASFTAVQYEMEQMNGYITVLSDVTEQEKIERERREFVANVSHELRTPLTTMKSYLETLTEGAWEDKEIAPRFLDVTQNETERMIRLVNDLLQLSKMDNKDYKMHKEKVNFIGFFQTVVERFEINQDDHINFERQLPDKEVQVWIDKDKMTQVLDNIISNAIKYSPEGGTIGFQLEINEHQQKLEVSISDEGVGIPKEKLEKVFERFYRVDKARARNLGGTGLGLAISREMIDAHGGEIWADSKEGKGTKVTFTLPLLKQYEGDEE
ncbi:MULTISPECIES: cell wall metabolism sensor histidine kinase WalK [Pontibacillus]|uniref:histidine kinase n=1 Tax=Pontibacillus chungwhensis TaxID=265426 RepID=A0ABY8UZZ6_9BACI|nr:MULTISPECIES: cell wall metabolism sensor histidine kinase WalK [Pontibacillus]MCD5325639.1 cell wall metabolism sensor histidine kinase WalK [Pontibacillus sp. HN14]WIF98114.1 cell wall metabolism sensor histidine kinase WalK [Pontibacillus chungwhensis]